MVPVDDELFGAPILLDDDMATVGAALDAAVGACTAEPDVTYRALTPLLDRMRESTPGVDFADLAVRLGWYDQAHFSNDFRTMLGWTPGEYASRYGS